MGKTIDIVLVVVGAVACLALTGLMPWAELGMTGAPDAWPLWLRWVNENLGLPLPNYDQVASLSTGWSEYLKKAGAESRFGDYAYSLVMGLAMVAAAIGIAAIGREEAEEKTVLPVKK
ncbi:MAG: hypothetical protein C0473_03445 [Cyanobacteria bacterium DS3.002]|nr:hypothetical protein [Cyanobacteria bacterium DS3.002]MBA4049711.1 hypothetical protein [Cyanobacteria bacterium DS2.008]MBA4077331.1 hypothetical protein [Cyanobacteria bacterium PR.023]MBP6747350.1 hypothetical protein [bacterium]MDQ5933002.1 hypothetical protein [Cyanobacteriota bacterium erpe_2018_sw_21hr_WHONDRS-SW48-000092_B_bin.40]